MRVATLTTSVVLVILAGCTAVSQTVLMPNLQPVHPQNVQIFLAGDSIPPHDRVAILSGSGNDIWTNRTQLLDHLRLRAGQLGANAVIIGQVEEASGGAKIAGALTGYGANRMQDAIAILLHDVEPITYSECDLLANNVTSTTEAYKATPNSQNRRRWEDAKNVYNEKCRE